MKYELVMIFSLQNHKKKKNGPVPPYPCNYLSRECGLYKASVVISYMEIMCVRSLMRSVIQSLYSRAYLNVAVNLLYGQGATVEPLLSGQCGTNYLICALFFLLSSRHICTGWVLGKQ